MIKFPLHVKLSGWLEYAKISSTVFFAVSFLIKVERMLLFHYVMLLLSLVAIGISMKVLMLYTNLMNKCSVIQNIKFQAKSVGSRVQDGGQTA